MEPPRAPGRSIRDDYGQSGALVELIERDGVLHVRKSAADETVRGRLRDQSALMSSFSCQSPIRTPHIVSPWNGAYFEMEYVPGVVLGEFLSSASLIEMKRVTHVLVSFLQEELEKASFEPCAVASVYEEFQLTMEDRLKRSSPWLQPQTVAELSTLPERGFLNAPSGNLHGDLSFENVLVQHGVRGVGLIDHSLAPVRSPVFDVARLALDAEFGWWFEARPGATAQLNSMHLLKGLWRVLSDFQIPATTMAAARILLVLRIWPYSSSPRRIALLRTSLLQDLSSIRLGVVGVT